MKTAISLPDDLFESADVLAKRLGLSRSELYATAVVEYLAKHRDEDVTGRLNEVFADDQVVSIRRCGPPKLMAHVDAGLKLVLDLSLDQAF